MGCFVIIASVLFQLPSQHLPHMYLPLRPIKNYIYLRNQQFPCSNILWSWSDAKDSEGEKKICTCFSPGLRWGIAVTLQGKAQRTSPPQHHYMETSLQLMPSPFPSWWCSHLKLSSSLAVVALQFKCKQWWDLFWLISLDTIIGVLGGFSAWMILITGFFFPLSSWTLILQLGCFYFWQHGFVVHELKQGCMQTEEQSKRKASLYCIIVNKEGNISHRHPVEASTKKEVMKAGQENDDNWRRIT